MLSLLALVTLIVGAQASMQELEVQISAQGYPVKSYNVTTSDGYILTAVRIPHGKDPAKRNGKVVLLMHGFVLCYNSFTYLPPDYAIAYNLADAGYDVWMGNARGTKFSRHHVSLNPDTNSKQFFDFSYEEIGLYDLPALIDFALAATNQAKLHYIGHSQGGAVFFVLTSMNTAYQSKFASANLLAGIGFQKYVPNPGLQILAPSVDALYPLSLQIDYVEIKPDAQLTIVLLNSAVNLTIPRELIGGASVKQQAHYLQNIRDKSFRRWNYGAATNLVKYGNKDPPSYDLSKIDLNVTIYYSVSDLLENEKDVLDMVAVLPHGKAHKIANSSFGHMDFMLNDDVKVLVTDYIIKDLNNL